MDTEKPPLHVVGDVHGHLTELIEALRAAGLLDTDANWAGGRSRLWFLGDFVDRGPDGIGVIELVMRLVGQAEEVGGQVEALLGNHEVLLLGTHQFGDQPVPSEGGPRDFARSWLINGGLLADQERLTERHLAWLTCRPVLALVDDHLLMHSDTTEYLEWGTTVDEVNDTVRLMFAEPDAVAWWDCWRRMTSRHAFHGPRGEQALTEVLATFGGRHLVHGHSTIPDLLGIEPEDVAGPHEYAGGRALDVDGGLFLGGPCLVVPLPWTGTAHSPVADTATPYSTA